MTVLELGITAPVAVPRTPVGRFVHYLRSEKALPQLIRFACVGTTSNIAYFLLFLALYNLGTQPANVAGWFVSTVLANELHRRLSFHATARVGWLSAQWEAGGLAVLGLGISALGLAGLGVLFPDANAVVQGGFVIAMTALVGLLRFVALRGLWFRARR